MKYILYPTKSDAQARSAEIATSLGCGREPEDVTRYWFGVLEHPDTKEAAIEIPDAQEENKLTGAEKTKLKLKDDLAKDGWFAGDKKNK